MELIRGLHNLKPEHRGCVATIGNFDGVHLGHEAVIAQLLEKGAALRLPSLIMLFEPQPNEFFQSPRVPARLMRFREKMLALRTYKIDRILCVRFDARLAGMEPEQFVDRILIDALAVRYLVIGDDFRFGKERRGDFATLQRAGAEHQFQVDRMRTFLVDGERVSSTRARAALAAADLRTAERLLGRPYRMCGRVARGEKIGRAIGIPTANIHLHRQVSPLNGIYTVKVQGLGSQMLSGVASIGTRPTVGGTQTLLEVHLLDFDQDIYGAHVCVEFLHKLRDERRFDSLSEMAKHIRQDIEDARRFFENRPGTQ